VFTHIWWLKSKHHEIVFPTSFARGNFHSAGYVFPCVYRRDMNNIRRIRAIISNSILLLIAFDQTQGVQPSEMPAIMPSSIPTTHAKPTDLVITNSYLVRLATKVTAGLKDVGFGFARSNQFRGDAKNCSKFAFYINGNSCCLWAHKLPHLEPTSIHIHPHPLLSGLLHNSKANLTRLCM